MSISKYAQASNIPKDSPNHPKHWTGIPPGSSLKDTSKCWCCKSGCAVLSYLYWKNEDPNEENIKNCLNSSADFDWSKNGLKQSTTIVGPSIGMCQGKHGGNHFIYIKSVTGKNCTCFDPDGGKDDVEYPTSKFSSCYKE